MLCSLVFQKLSETDLKLKFKKSDSPFLCLGNIQEKGDFFTFQKNRFTPYNFPEDELYSIFFAMIVLTFFLHLIIVFTVMEI